jgi:hypothetical protein
MINEQLIYHGKSDMHFAPMWGLLVIPLNTVAPCVWTQFEREVFYGITKNKNFNEKKIMKHLDADKLSHYSVKSIRKFIHRRMIELEVVDEAGNHQKKKWTPPEVETLQDAIVVHGYKVKLIIKVNAYDNGLAEKICQTD